MQATFRLILLCGESGACDGPGPDVDAGDSSEDGVGTIELNYAPEQSSHERSECTLLISSLIIIWV